jgi:PAB1-binding protein PBP1
MFSLAKTYAQQFLDSSAGKTVYCFGGGCQDGLVISPHLPTNFIDVFPPKPVVSFDSFCPGGVIASPCISIDVPPVAVPEPGAVALFLLGGAMMLLARWVRCA